MKIRKIAQRGFTLIELMIVVAIIGVLAALAVYGVTRYLASSKTAEARNALGRLGKDVTSAYEGENMDTTVLTLKGSTAISRRLCKTSTKVPAADGAIKGKKYQSDPGEWVGADKETGWTCLKFSMQDPQYYQYEYISLGGSAADVTADSIAHGDLDADGALSTFKLAGKIQAATGGGLIFTLAPSIEIGDEFE